jgi:hypothetical protein
MREVMCLPFPDSTNYFRKVHVLHYHIITDNINGWTWQSSKWLLTSPWVKIIEMFHPFTSWKQQLKSIRGSLLQATTQYLARFKYNMGRFHP